MGRFSIKKIADPSSFFTAETRTTRSMFDPGSALTGDKLNRITDPLNLLADPLITPPTTKPRAIGPTAVRRPIEERLVTDFFVGVTGPTDAVTDLRRRRLLTQRGPAATPGGISAAARALIVGSTGKSAEEFAAEELAARRLELSKRPRGIRRGEGPSAPGDFGGVGGFGIGGNPGAGMGAFGGDVGFG